MLQAAESALAKPRAEEAAQAAAAGGADDSDDGGGGGGGGRGGGGGDEEDDGGGEGAAAGGAEIEIEITLSQAERQEGEARLPAMRRRLQAMSLPGSPLDTLIGLLGGPGCVAEMTGRKKRREWLMDSGHPDQGGGHPDQGGGHPDQGGGHPPSGRWGSALVSAKDLPAPEP